MRLQSKGRTFIHEIFQLTSGFLARMLIPHSCTPEPQEREGASLVVAQSCEPLFYCPVGDTAILQAGGQHISWLLAWVWTQGDTVLATRTLRAIVK